MIYKKEKQPIEMIKINESGHFVEIINIYEQSEITKYIVMPWNTDSKFYFPVYDFDLQDWVEGLSEFEIQTKQQEELELSNPPQKIEILEQENTELKRRLEDAEMAIIVLMDSMPIQ